MVDCLLWSFVVIGNLIRAFKYLNLIDYNPDKTFQILDLTFKILDLTWIRFNVMLFSMG